MPRRLSAHLRRLESEAIHIMREVVAEFRKPVMLYSIGKDSTAMLHVAQKAFFPAVPPFPLLHVDTTWKFKEMIAFRDDAAKRAGMELIVHINQDGVRRGISPVASGSSVHTQVMKTEGLRQALDQHGFDAAFGGARRDEEKSRAKERVFSHRSEAHAWDPRNQRPELWHLYNTRIRRARACGCSPCRTGPSSTCGTTSRPRRSRSCRSTSPRSGRSCERDGALIMVDDERLPMRPGETPEMRRVRFRTLGCYPLTGAVESDADDARRGAGRDARFDHLRAPGPPDRLRRGRLHGKEEAGRVFLMAGDDRRRAAARSPPCASSPAARSTTASRR